MQTSESKSRTFAPWLMVFPSFKFTDTFAFGAPKVIGHFVTIWMIKYADMVIVSGMESSLCITSLLYSSDIGRHTSILFIRAREGAKKAKKADSQGVEEVDSQGEEEADSEEAEGANSQKAEKAGSHILVARYAWEHKTQRPNTHTFPLTCPVCHTLQPWQNPGGFWNEEGTEFTLKCTAKIGGRKCLGSTKVEARPPSTLLASPYVGKWYSYNQN